MKKIKLYIYLFLVLIEIISIFLTIKSFSNKPIVEEKEINEVDKKQFSMFISDEEGNYIEYTESNKFPEGYIINLENSKCIDTKGNIIDGILSGNGTNITVTSTKTAYCYLYFDIDNRATQYLIANVSSDVLWNSTLEDDGYRYVGTDPSNYICFGTTDSATCTGDTDLYMYRIIGIFEDSEGIQHLKLIKKEALNTSYYWHSSNVDIDWDETDLYKGINGSYFLDNETYSYMQDTNWTDKIETWNYIATNTKTYEFKNDGIYGVSYNTSSVKLTYLHEMNRSSLVDETHYWSDGTPVDVTLGEWKTVIGKLSLMYASDYQLSLGKEVLSYNNKDNYNTIKNGWMHISNNDSGAPSSVEGIMSRYGALSDGGAYLWYVDSGGSIGAYYVNFAAGSVRPVFYLTSDVTISGEGTTTNPYIITN